MALRNRIAIDIQIVKHAVKQHYILTFFTELDNKKVVIVVVVVFFLGKITVIGVFGVWNERISEAIVGHKAVIENVIVVDFDLGSVGDDKRFGGEAQRRELRRHFQSNTCQNR
jgi:hypothetical protein